jgi:O-antigen/teichoic acid export membrane protein
MKFVSLTKYSGHPRNALALDIFARTSSSAVTSIFVVRYLGPTRSGILLLAFTLSAIGVPFAAAGTNEILFQRFADGLKFIAKPVQLSSGFELPGVEFGDEWIQPAWEIRVRASVLAFVFCSVLGAVLTNDLATILLSSIGLVAVPFDLSTVRLIAHRNLRIAIRRRVAVIAAIAILKLSAVALHLPLPTFAALTSLETIGLALASHLSQAKGVSIPCSRNPFSTDPRIHLKRRALRRSSLPFLVATILNLAILRIDVLLVKAMLGAAEVGRYGAIVRIVELALLPFAVVVPMALTSFRMQTDPASSGFGSKTRFLFGRVAAIAAIPSLAIALFGPQLLKLLYGKQFALGTTNALRLLSVAVPFAVCVTLRDSYFALIKRENLVIWGPLIGLFVNIGLNLFLLRSIGLAGASIASVAGYGVALLVPFALLALGGRTVKTELNSSLKIGGKP